MLAFVAIAAMMQDPEPPVERTPAIYRCPAAEAESTFWPSLVDEHYFDSYCVEPKPGPKAKQVVKDSKLAVKFIQASIIDTPANLKWRNATIDFVNGKISPKAWLARTKASKATVHFLSSPKTPTLREATKQESPNAVCAELLVLTWPGRPCFTADDIWQTRYLPGPGRLQSWILSMNDLLGPAMYGRARDKFLTTQQPEIVRADDKPGLLIYRYKQGKHIETFYVNNGPKPIEINPKMDNVSGICRGLNLDGEKPMLLPFGFVNETEGGE
jgi:hypothetical protein